MLDHDEKRQTECESIYEKPERHEDPARLEGAKQSCSRSVVNGTVLDAPDSPRSPGFDCVVAGLFWSHDARATRPGFLSRLSGALDHGTRVVFFDNLYAEGSSTPISVGSDEGDTYQLWTLSDGSTHELLENFPGANEVRHHLSRRFRDVSVTALD